jgi:hypothetical protein
MLSLNSYTLVKRLDFWWYPTLSNWDLIRSIFEPSLTAREFSVRILLFGQMEPDHLALVLLDLLTHCSKILINKVICTVA